MFIAWGLADPYHLCTDKLLGSSGSSCVYGSYQSTWHVFKFFNSQEKINNT